MWQLVDSWCPKGIRSAWGRSVKCLGLIAGVSVHCLTPAPYCLFCHSSQFSSRSRAFGKGKEPAASQASQVAHQARLYFSFSTMKWPGVFLLTPGWDASPLQSYTPAFKFERGTVRVKCLAQEHDTMSQVRAQNPFLEPPLLKSCNHPKTSLMITVTKGCNSQEQLATLGQWCTVKALHKSFFY